MTRRRAAVVAVAAVAGAAALTAVARSEGERHLQSQLDGLARVRAAVGRIDSPNLTAIRPSLAGGYMCLAYQRGDHPAALELCFDRDNRLLEASDRRGDLPQVYTLRFDPEAARIVLPAAQVRAAAEAARRGLVRSAWAAPVQYLYLCRRLAAGARRAERDRPALAADAAGSCTQAVEIVSFNAKSARIAGSRAAEQAGIEYAALLRGYAAALRRLSQNPAGAGLRAYDRAAASLDRRKAAVDAQLRKREPWLRVPLRLPE